MPLPEISNDAVDEVLRHAPGVMALAQSSERADGHPNLVNLLAAMEFTDFTAPFDWQAEFGPRPDFLQSLEVVDHADLETLRKIMTAHIRIDRFDHGHLERLVQSGYWTRCLERLRQLRAQM
jgi:hypothetical protein